MLGNRLPEGGFEDERSVRRFLYSPLDLCMLEEQGVEEGLEDSIVWWSRPCTGRRRYCPDGRHPKRNPALLLTHHVKVELSRGLPTSREVKSGESETRNLEVAEEAASPARGIQSRHEGRGRCRNCSRWRCRNCSRGRRCRNC